MVTKVQKVYTLKHEILDDLRDLEIEVKVIRISIYKLREKARERLILDSKD